MRRNRDGAANWFSPSGRSSLFFLLSLGVFASLHAESFEEYKRSQMASFSAYKEARDKAFRNYLQKEWQAYRLSQGRELYEEPKPREVPQAQKLVRPPVGPRVLIRPVEPLQITPPREPEEKPAIVPGATSFAFFGTAVTFTVPKSIEQARFAPATQAGIGAYFEALATGDYEGLLEGFQSYKKRLALNDWGLYLLVKSAASHIYDRDDEARLFTWFFLGKLGYAAKIGLSGAHPVLLLHSKKSIYATPHYSFNKRRYYALDYYAKEGAGSLYTYRREYPGADRPLDLALNSLPLLGERPQKKSLHFRYRGERHDLDVEYDENLIEFMATYPQADYATYFNAPLSQPLRESLVSELKPLLDGKQASSAVNLLLFFVQNAFRYKVDDEQFGREKVMFAEETLYYDASDCEDRAVLFAYLVRELFDVEVVGIKYKDHMATALALPIKGDELSIGKRRYVIADPTYINATVGQSMPKYRSVIPESFIRVK